MTTTPNLTSTRERVPADFAAMQDYFWDQEWTGGLPVRRPLRRPCGSGWRRWRPARSARRGVMQPSNSRATLDKLAINAVMAGCRHEHIPVVVTAVKEFCDGSTAFFLHQLREKGVADAHYLAGDELVYRLVNAALA